MRGEASLAMKASRRRRRVDPCLDVSGLAMIRTATGLSLLVANTGDSLQSFSIRPRQHGTGASAPVP